MRFLLALPVVAMATMFSVSATARDCPVITDVEVVARCMQQAAASHPVAWCKKADNLATARQKLIDERIGMFEAALAAWNKDIRDSAPIGDAEATATYYQDALKGGLANFKETVASCREDLNRK